MGESSTSAFGYSFSPLLTLHQTTTASTQDGIVYRDRKLLNGKAFLGRRNEQLTQKPFPLNTRIQKAIGFPVKNESC
jgi:hypothetical protein